MAHEPDHKQVELLLIDESYNRVHRMARSQVRYNCYTRRLRLRARRVEHGGEPVVRFGLFFLDLVDRGRETRQFLNRDHVKRGSIPLCQRDRGRKRFQRAGRAIIRHQNSPVHFTDLPAPRLRSRVWLVPLASAP